MYNSKNGGGVNLFFFGDSNESIAVGTDKGNFNPSGKTFYLCKRSDNKNWTESDSKKNVVYINADGSRADGGNDLGATFKTKVQKYASYNASYKKNGKDSYPTTDEFLGSASKLGLKRTAPSTATETSLATFLRDNCYQKKKHMFLQAHTVLHLTDLIIASHQRTTTAITATAQRFLL